MVKEEKLNVNEIHASNFPLISQKKQPADLAETIPLNASRPPFFLHELCPLRPCEKNKLRISHFHFHISTFPH
jgi:hypothetical protein